MKQLRILVASLVTLSLLVVPASIGASAAAMTAMGIAIASDCGSSCAVAGQIDMADTMAGVAMPGDCRGPTGKGTPISPAACAALCSGLVFALPSFSSISVRDVTVRLPGPGVQAELLGHIGQPEPPPPRS
jgi:hypothetical protein